MLEALLLGLWKPRWIWHIYYSEVICSHGCLLNFHPTLAGSLMWWYVAAVLNISSLKSSHLQGTHPENHFILRGWSGNNISNTCLSLNYTFLSWGLLLGDTGLKRTSLGHSKYHRCPASLCYTRNDVFLPGTTHFGKDREYLWLDLKTKSHKADYSTCPEMKL